MVIYVNTFDDLLFDGVLFGRCKGWLLIISTQKDMVHVFTSTDERFLNGLVREAIKKGKGTPNKEYVANCCKGLASFF